MKSVSVRFTSCFLIQLSSIWKVSGLLPFALTMTPFPDRMTFLVILLYSTPVRLESPVVRDVRFASFFADVPTPERISRVIVFSLLIIGKQL